MISLWKFGQDQLGEMNGKVSADVLTTLGWFRITSVPVFRKLYSGRISRTISHSFSYGTISIS